MKFNIVRALLGAVISPVVLCLIVYGVGQFTDISLSIDYAIVVVEAVIILGFLVFGFSFKIKK